MNEEAKALALKIMREGHSDNAARDQLNRNFHSIDWDTREAIVKEARAQVAKELT